MWRNNIRNNIFQEVTLFRRYGQCDIEVWHQYHSISFYKAKFNLVIFHYFFQTVCFIYYILNCVIQIFGCILKKWNESGFRPPLCTYRLNWARRTSWGWWDDWDDTVLQTQESKFEPWRSEAEHATSRSRRLPTILTFTRGWGRNIFCFFQTAETGNRTRNSGVKGSGANHYPRAPALDVYYNIRIWQCPYITFLCHDEAL